MANYDSLKGVYNYSDTDISQLLAASYIMFLDWGLVNIGAFSNVTLSDANINAANRSLLRLGNDPDYNTGQVWETFHSNIVWESGISTVTQPISISGIYIGSTFYPLSSSTSGTYAYNIDYNLGRVVFNSAIATTSSVKMEYSYKKWTVVEAKDHPYLKEIQFNSFDPNNNGFSQSGSGEYDKHPATRLQLPLIGVEVTPHQECEPHELGNYVQRIDTDIIFHIIGETDSDVKRMVNILTRQKEGATFLLDMDAIARSGMFPVRYDGTLNTNPKTYPQLVQLFRHAFCTMTKSEGMNLTQINNNVYHGSVRATIETIY